MEKYCVHLAAVRGPERHPRTAGRPRAGRSAFALATALAAACLVLSAPTAATAVPLPDQDPFYAVPTHIAGLANGAILKSRRVSASAYSLPLPANAWQVQYKSL